MAEEVVSVRETLKEIRENINVLTTEYHDMIDEAAATINIAMAKKNDVVAMNKLYNEIQNGYRSGDTMTKEAYVEIAKLINKS